MFLCKKIPSQKTRAEYRPSHAGGIQLFSFCQTKNACHFNVKAGKKDAGICKMRTFGDDELRSGENVKNVNKNAGNVFDKMESYVILMLNRYIRKSTKILLEA